MSLEKSIDNLALAIDDLSNAINSVYLRKTESEQETGLTPEKLPPEDTSIDFGDESEDTSIDFGDESEHKPLEEELGPSADQSANTEVDADGIPWDPRIHARTRKKNADGRWRLKRGVPKEIVDQVMRNLLASAAPAPVQAPAQPQAQAPEQAPVQAPAQPQAQAQAQAPEQAQAQAPEQAQAQAPAQPQAQAPEQAQAQAPEQAQAQEIVMERIRARASEVARVLGPQAGKIIDLLSRFGVDRLSALPPEFYVDFMEGLNRIEQGGEP